ncbi:ribbon-helix-helix domain-containing protein [Agromyces badenianii]|uniref:ribbon-helix-helix domain-containing protein n=1 Tax=Agromyces badenianii TaxID=2080742 RepID=UPI0014046586|nr:ribbon-helix-helix domain-containing protein [Agromyces badenianii]
MTKRKSYTLSTDPSDEPVTLPDGTVLDGEVAEQYAERALANARRSNLIPGRKSLSGGSKHSPVIQFRAPETLREQTEARAEAEGVSVSELARRALEQYLAS